MANTNPQEGLLNANFEDFAISLLPLYSGPQITLRVGSAGQEYKLPKALLFKQSPYFAAMFNGSWGEGEESTTLEEIERVVSTQSLQMLVQWVCLGRVQFGNSTHEETIGAAIEFARLADMCGIVGVENLMAEKIKAAILAFSVEKDDSSYPPPDANTRCLTSQNIVSAVNLPDGHPVRGVLAAATVRGCLTCEKYKFEDEVSNVHGFSADLLKATRDILKTITNDNYENSSKLVDPITSKKFSLGRRN